MQFGGDPRRARVARSAVASLALAFVGLALAAAPAAATFHLVVVREVYAGSATNPQSEYVELQAYAPGQNFVQGHFVRFYDAGGNPTGTASFPQDVSNGQSQMTLLVGTAAVQSQFGVSPDATMAADSLNPAGGAVCWETIDCVSWGGFSGSLPSPSGSPAAPAGIPDGMALRRTIAPGCATLLEPTDDRNDGSLDFSAAFPNPRPNSAPPSEHPCPSAGAGGGGGGGGAPQTTLRRRPAKRTRDRTPTFRFSSDEPGSTFQCKLDGKPYRRCRSPFTIKRLSLGRHRFKVRARDASGLLDPSPASYTFRVIAKP